LPGLRTRAGQQLAAFVWSHDATTEAVFSALKKHTHTQNNNNSSLNRAGLNGFHHELIPPYVSNLTALVLVDAFLFDRHNQSTNRIDGFGINVES
jgi:hypothetical protein